MDITITISKEEYTQFLAYKKAKIQKEAQLQIALIEEQLASILNQTQKLGTEKAINGKSKKGSVGWKHIIDEILMKSDKPLGNSAIVEAALNRPDLDITPKVALRSVSSNLSTLSKGAHKRYHAEIKNGKKVYSLIKTLNE